LLIVVFNVFFYFIICRWNTDRVYVRRRHTSPNSLRPAWPIEGPWCSTSIKAGILWHLSLCPYFLFLLDVLLAVVNAVSIIGIPNIPNHLKMAYYWLWPFGYEYYNLQIPPVPPADPRTKEARKIWEKYVNFRK